MSISEEVSFDKDGNIVRFPLLRKLFLSLVIILVATLSFGIGRLSVIGDREPIKIEYDPALTQEPSTSINQTANVINSNPAVFAPSGTSEVVVSKNGSKYHFLHCPSVKQIKEENKIFFATPAAAEAAGYTLAANCKPR